MNFKLIVFVLTVLGPLTSGACDDLLKVQTSDPSLNSRLAQDCRFQDRYQRIQNIFNSMGREVTEVAEFRALRFISRDAWERNILSEQKSPAQIYEPAPLTWDIWDSGIRKVFKSRVEKNRLQRSYRVDKNALSNLNIILMENDNQSVKLKTAFENKNVGIYRDYLDNSSGTCVSASENTQAAIQRSDQSLKKFQQRLEIKLGKSLPSFIASAGGQWPEKASLLTGMETRRNSCGPQLSRDFFTYTPGHMVAYQINWLTLVLDKSLTALNQKKPLMAPTELAAFIQKWFVSIHPFVDGNGRTSRVLQDLILENYGLPFAAGGDLQNDALEDIDKYIEQNYQATDRMLSFLEDCAQRFTQKRALGYRCSSILDLN